MEAGPLELPDIRSVREHPVLRLAREEARRLGHPYVAPEHILLALLQVGDPEIDEVIRRHGLTAEAVRKRLVSVLPPGAAAWSSGDSEIPYSSRAKRVIALASSGVDDSNFAQVGARVFLEAIVGEARNVAAAVLRELGIPGRQPRPAPLDAMRERLERAGLDSVHRPVRQHRLRHS